MSNLVNSEAAMLRTFVRRAVPSGMEITCAYDISRLAYVIRLYLRVPDGSVTTSPPIFVRDAELTPLILPELEAQIEKHVALIMEKAGAK